LSRHHQRAVGDPLIKGALRNCAEAGPVATWDRTMRKTARLSELDALIDDLTVDAYNDEEQLAGFLVGADEALQGGEPASAGRRDRLPKMPRLRRGWHHASARSWVGGPRLAADLRSQFEFEQCRGDRPHCDVVERRRTALASPGNRARARSQRSRSSPPCPIGSARCAGLVSQALRPPA